MSNTIIWKNEIENIQKLVNEGYTTQKIGDVYSVSKQRIFQVMTQFGIPTPIRSKHNFLKDKPIKYYWLNKMLVTKKISKSDRLQLLKSLTLPDVCPMLGIILNYSGGYLGKPGWGRGEDSPSLDQIKPNEGYTLNNIQVISWRANRIKNDGTADELIKIGTYLKDNYTS